MNCIKTVENIAKQLLSVIQQQPDIELLETHNHGWENHRYTSPQFRLAHVQIFKQERFVAVHICVFPHATDPAPIYGFDVVAGENKITGVFLDLSPTVKETQPFTNLNVSRIRDRPEWGDIFSHHWLACRPTIDEISSIGDEAEKVLIQYLTTLGEVADQKLITDRQNYYCFQQCRNQHTRKALVNILGDIGANEYMTKILFPLI